MSKLKYALNKMRLLNDYKKGKVVSRGKPFIHSIEVTNNCNLSCVMCNRGEEKTRGLGTMSVLDFRMICNKFGDCFKALALFFHGEPLLNPNLVEMVKIAKPFASTVNLTTNGTLLDPFRARALMAAGLYSLTVSFEGVNKKVYEEVRRGAEFRVVMDNIISTLDIRDVNSFSTKINIACVVMDQTKPYIEGFKKRWEGMGVNGFRFIPLHGWGEEKNVGLGNTEGLRRENPRCLAPWFGFHVGWNGDVLPCCLWSGDKDDPFLGNVLEVKDIMDLWNGPLYQDFRLRHLDGCRGLKRCENCRIDPYTEAISLSMVQEFFVNPVNRRIGKYAGRLQG